MARPPKYTPEEKAQLEKQISLLAQCGCTMDEIAAKVGVSRAELYRDYETVIKNGREIGHTSLRGKQFELAMKGNVPMLIWLGKQLLGQSEKIDYTHTSDADLIAAAEAAGIVIGDAAQRVNQPKRKGEG